VITLALAVVRQLAESAGGGPESYYWMFGQYDGTARPGLIVDVSVALMFGAVLIVVYRCVSATARAAVRMTSVTARGCEIMITCEPSTSVMSAPAR
jgi:uncharacterized protein with GYD domain